MATRNLLHRSKLTDFLEWAKSMGAKIEPGRGYYQRVRVKFPDEPVHIIWDRSRGDHYTLETRTTRLFWKYMNMQKAKKVEEDNHE